MATAQVIQEVSAQQLAPGVNPAPESRVLPPQEEFVPTTVPTEIFPPEQWPEARPAHVLFAGLRDPRLRMAQAIPLDVTSEESTVVVHWPAINEFGTGDTLTAAIDDFSDSLRELYWHFSSSDVKLGEDLQKVKAIIEQYIQPRR
jgi:hypothetical protein